MTEEQKEIIKRLRNVGLGYRKIGTVVDLSRDKVRNYCKANNLDGYAKNLIQSNEGRQMEREYSDSVCRQCGKPLVNKPTGRKKVYCSDECRKVWIKEHPVLYKHECMFCGKKFESQVKEQKFCSHECYIRNRFWREEDTKEIVNLLLARKKVTMVPKWIKELLET